jgi:hypothetical protein
MLRLGMLLSQPGAGAQNLVLSYVWLRRAGMSKDDLTDAEFRELHKRLYAVMRAMTSEQIITAQNITMGAVRR